AGIPLEAEALLRQLLFPAGRKATTPKASKSTSAALEEDTDSETIRRKEAMAHVLKVQVGRAPLDPSSDRSAENLAAAAGSDTGSVARMNEDEESTYLQETQMKGALHTLFRRFAK
ncbi:unnamed protein product, partial [Polarella glacialis]